MLFLSKNLLQVNNINNKIKIIFFLIILFLPVVSIAAIADINDTDRKQFPLSETIDLLLDGSTPIRINLTKDFDFISRILFELGYDDPTFIGSEFAKGSALSNGICICVNNEPFFDFNITKNDHFPRIAYDTTIFQDDKQPAETHIYSRFSFSKFSSPYGLAYTSNSSFFVIIQDDMTAVSLAIVEFNLEIQGFRWDETKIEQQELTNPFDTMNIWFVWFLSMWPLWLVTIIILAVFIYILIQIL